MFGKNGNTSFLQKVVQVIFLTAAVATIAACAQQFGWL
tara:strand:- start:2283 stop:2396 length:114 start_codon:yes stop_codon:yes gene_type:complete